MTLNSALVLAGLAALLFFTNPDQNRHREALSPVFLQHVNSLSNRMPGLEEEWTFLPNALDYGNYLLFSMTRYPREIPTEGTAAEGILTLGVLGSVFVLFPNSASAGR